MKPGDIFLSRDDFFVDHLIRYGQTRPRLGISPEYTGWNHVALVTSTDGDLIEARAKRGVIRSHVSNYRTHAIGPLEATDEQRAALVAFATSMVGKKYGWTALVGIMYRMFTGRPSRWGLRSVGTCGGFVALMLSQLGIVFSVPTQHVTPAHIAAYYGISCL